MKTKYITFINEYGADDIVVFSFCQNHANVAQRLQLQKEDILGAGFIAFTVERTKETIYTDYVAAHCFGESTSLKIISRVDADSKVANTMLIDPP